MTSQHKSQHCLFCSNASSSSKFIKDFPGWGRAAEDGDGLILAWNNIWRCDSPQCQFTDPNERSWFILHTCIDNKCLQRIFWVVDPKREYLQQTFRTDWTDLWKVKVFTWFSDLVVESYAISDMCNYVNNDKNLQEYLLHFVTTATVARVILLSYSSVWAPVCCERIIKVQVQFDHLFLWYIFKAHSPALHPGKLWWQRYAFKSTETIYDPTTEDHKVVYWLPSFESTSYRELWKVKTLYRLEKGLGLFGFF